MEIAKPRDQLGQRICWRRDPFVRMLVLMSGELRDVVWVELSMRFEDVRLGRRRCGGNRQSWIGDQELRESFMLLVFLLKHSSRVSLFHIA
jgi:hypothetical protein